MKRGVVLVVVLAGVLAFVALAGYRVKSSIDRNAQKAPDAEAVAPPSVAVALVEKKDLPQIVAITGVVRARNEAVIFAKMPGRVTKLNVDVGQVVKAGDTLAILEATDLFYRVKQAEAQLKAAQAGLENAKVQQRTATSGWERAQSLHKKGAMSQVELEQAEAGFHLANAGIAAAEAQAALADASLGLANDAYANSRVTTPIAGIVARKHVDVGAFAAPGQPAFVIQDQTALKMTGTIPAGDVPLVKKGMPVRVTVDELPGRELEGTLTYVAPTLEAESRRAAVEVALAPVEGLLPYMFGHADIAFGEKADVLVVPASAVLPTADGAIMYAVRDGRAVLVKPDLGTRVGDDIVVRSGVDAGERVIISGDTGIKDGIAVAVTGARGEKG